MICVDVKMSNSKLSETKVIIPVQPNDGWKKAVTCKQQNGIICTGVSRSDESIVDGIPAWAVTNGWFTINALKVGVCDIVFTFSDGSSETINVTVNDPNQSVNEVIFQVPKSATKVVLVIER